jgi:hypothetical protein
MSHTLFSACVPVNSTINYSSAHNTVTVYQREEIHIRLHSLHPAFGKN